MPLPVHYSFQNVVRHLRRELLKASEVDTGEWQAQKGGAQSRTLEIEDVSFALAIPESLEDLQELVRPNLPWAEDHFLERVSGTPHNPPPSAAWWPYKQKDHQEHTDAYGQFSHTYPERFWPVVAPMLQGHPRQTPNSGIRFAYGDLGDVVELLRERRHTRQAYLPVWFPEDLTASRLGHRVPCTLGYHFMVRDGQLKITYYIRSCDFIRHFADDVYMAARLAQWVCSEIQYSVVPGRLVMHISSLHVFSVDRQVLAYQARKDPIG